MPQTRLACTMVSPLREFRGGLISFKNAQSYPPLCERPSFRLNLPLILRQCCSTVSSTVNFRCTANRRISSSLIQTYPGPPVQQLPQQVQVNFKPWLYQRGSFEFLSGGITSSFILELYRE